MPQITPSLKHSRTYATQERLQQAIDKVDAFKDLEWAATVVVDEGSFRWTAVFFLRSGDTHMARLVAEYGFKVVA